MFITDHVVTIEASQFMSRIQGQFASGELNLGVPLLGISDADGKITAKCADNANMSGASLPVNLDGNIFGPVEGVNLGAGNVGIPKTLPDDYALLASATNRNHFDVWCAATMSDGSLNYSDVHHLSVTYITPPVVSVSLAQREIDLSGPIDEEITRSTVVTTDTVGKINGADVSTYTLQTTIKPHSDNPNDETPSIKIDGSPDKIETAITRHANHELKLAWIPRQPGRYTWDLTITVSVE